MNLKRSFEPQLALTNATVPAGTEWLSQSKGWTFVHIAGGIGYWLNPRINHELVKGAALLLSARAQGVLRASQVGEVSLEYFRLDASRLPGLVTWPEQQALELAANQESFAVRCFAPTTRVAQTFQTICASQRGNGLAFRVKLLELFSDAVSDRLNEQQPYPVCADAKMRLQRLLNETPVADLLEMDFNELVRQVRCTGRHLTRIFHEVVGMSFREKQTQLRLLRAQELLATTETKVVDIAFESGYRSLSLFNLMFKRRFGTTPAKWRDRRSLNTSTRSSVLRLQMFRNTTQRTKAARISDKQL